MPEQQVPQGGVWDMVCDRDASDEALAARGMGLIARIGALARENWAQNDRSPLLYRRCWVVERTVAWLRHFQRLCI